MWKNMQNINCEKLIFFFYITYCWSRIINNSFFIKFKNKHFLFINVYYSIYRKIVYNIIPLIFELQTYFIFIVFRNICDICFVRKKNNSLLQATQPKYLCIHPFQNDQLINLYKKKDTQTYYRIIACIGII